MLETLQKTLRAFSLTDLLNLVVVPLLEEMGMTVVAQSGESSPTPGLVVLRSDELVGESFAAVLVITGAPDDAVMQQFLARAQAMTPKPTKFFLMTSATIGSRAGGFIKRRSDVTIVDGHRLAELLTRRLPALVDRISGGSKTPVFLESTFTNTVLAGAIRGEPRSVGSIYLDPDISPDHMRPKSVLVEGFHPTKATFSIGVPEWDETRRVVYRRIPESFGVHVILEPSEEEAERELTKKPATGRVEVLAVGHDLARRIEDRRDDIRQRANQLNSAESSRLSELREFFVQSDTTLRHYRELVCSPIITAILRPERLPNTEDVLGGVTISCELEKVFDTGLNIVLLGEAGSGKTMALQHYAQQKILEGSRRLVAFVRLASLLPQLQEVFADAVVSRGVEALIRAIASYLDSEGVPISVRNLRKQCLTGEILLILDGIDEIVAGAAWAVDAIVALSEKYPRLQILTSSRFSGDHVTKIPFIGISLRPFSRPQIDQFVKSWFGARQSQKTESIFRFLDDNPDMAALVRSPLMLTILCASQEHGVQLPCNEIRLLEERVELLLGRYDVAKRVSRLQTDSGTLRRVARRLAYALHTEGRREGQLDELLAIARQGSSSAKEAELAVRELIDPCNLLVPASASGGFGFGHLRFQEYLAACELTTNRGLAFGDHDTVWWAGVFELARQMMPHDQLTELAGSIPRLGSKQDKKLRLRRAELVDKRFLGQISSQELDELRGIDKLLDEIEAPFYEGTIETLRQRLSRSDQESRSSNASEEA